MKEKILAIDSDPFTLSVIKQALESAGYRVLTALDGESGWQQFHKSRPDLVILDVMLPEADGWKICQRIRYVSNAPIIIHTALESPEHLLQAIKVGANDYLVKPVTPEVIQIHVDTLLKGRVQREQLLPAWLSYLSTPHETASLAEVSENFQRAKQLV
jgi:two-component system response regulator ResD